MPTIPAHLRIDPEWGSVAAVLDHFPTDDRVWPHVNIKKREIDFDAILADGTFSSSEAMLLRAAASLWRGWGHELSLGHMANVMGEDALRVVLRALAAYCRAPITWAAEPV